MEVTCHHLGLGWQWCDYCLLFAVDSQVKENYKGSKKKRNYWKDCEILTGSKGRVCYRKHCHRPDDRLTEFEYQYKSKT